MAISKVVYDDTALIDLTGDTVTAEKILKGFTAHAKNGEQITGSCTFDMNSRDIKTQEKTVTSGFTTQSITPDTGFTHLSKVTVKPVPYAESANSAGGVTVTIG